MSFFQNLPSQKMPMLLYLQIRNEIGHIFWEKIHLWESQAKIKTQKVTRGQVTWAQRETEWDSKIIIESKKNYPNLLL